MDRSCHADLWQLVFLNHQLIWEEEFKWMEVFLVGIKCNPQGIFSTYLHLSQSKRCIEASCGFAEIFQPGSFFALHQCSN